MNILVYIPERPDQPRVEQRTLDSINALRWTGRVQIVFDRHDNPQSRGYLDICEKYKRARAMMLAEDYDALLTIEADMIVPPTALLRLVAVCSDVSYGLYCSRHSTQKWLAFSSLSPAVSLADNEYTARSAWGNVVQTEGAGLGCTLISRRVLEAVPFVMRDGGPACDWWFAQDVKSAGFKQAHDLAVVCGHIRDDGRVIWPDINKKGFYRIDDV